MTNITGDKIELKNGIYVVTHGAPERRNNATEAARREKLRLERRCRIKNEFNSMVGATIKSVDVEECHAYGISLLEITLDSGTLLSLQAGEGFIEYEF